MNHTSRRHFLTTSSTALAGAILAPTLLAKDKKGDESTQSLSLTSQSGLITGQKKPLKYVSIPEFLSEEQIKVHFEGHYGGALNGYTAADHRLQSSIINEQRIDSNTYGALQRARTTKGNSVLLHELYFDGMSPNPPAIPPEVKLAIERRFETVDKWAKDFKACAKASSGWAILAFHPVNGKLYNVVSDTHSSGVNWMAMPLVVLDVYEHAYYIDFKNKKSDYIDKFLTHVDYQSVNERLRLKG